MSPAALRAQRYLDFLARRAPLAEAGRLYRDHLSTFGQSYPASTVLPYLCPAHWRPRLADLSRRIADATESLAATYRRGDSALVDHVRLPAHVRSWVQRAESRGETHPIIRVDAFLDPDGERIEILELNTGDPSALAWHDWMIRGLRKVPGFAEAQTEMGLEWEEMVPRHVRLFRELFPGREFADARIAFLMPPGSSVYFDFCAFAQLYREHASHVELCDPRSIDVSRFDAFLRDTLDDICSPDGSHTRPEILDGFAENRWPHLNPLPSVLGDQKTLLPFFPGTIPVLNTRALSIDADWGAIRAERGDWVLKPADGYGGHGVFIGQELDDATWSRRLDAIRAEGRDYVVQRYAPTPRIPWLRNGRLEDAFGNFSFWILNGELAGAFARASSGRIINTHQGGGLVPVLFCRED